jgi:succinate-semialdehyde dehydrogenase/glutarate-semialdehyde dehydrogenase
MNFFNYLGGAVAINEMMRSDSKMPSGGCKQSGYGRECGSFGYSEFANIKSTFVSKL